MSEKKEAPRKGAEMLATMDLINAMPGGKDFVSISTRRGHAPLWKHYSPSTGGDRSICAGGLRTHPEFLFKHPSCELVCQTIPSSGVLHMTAGREED